MNRATDRFYTASDAFLAQCRHELAHEERRPTRYAQAGFDNVRLRSPTEPSLEKLDDGGACQGLETDRIGRWIRRHGRKQLSFCPRSGRAGGDDERDLQLFEPREQEGQVTERCGVCPVRIVDDQAERAQRRRGSRTASRGRGGSRRKDRRPGKGDPLQDVRQRAQACQQQRRQRLAADQRARAPMPRPAAARTAAARLRKRSWSPSSVARARSTRIPPSAAAVSGGREQRRLADPGRPFDYNEPAAPRASVGERRLDPRQLIAPLEQRSGGRWPLS